MAAQRVWAWIDRACTRRVILALGWLALIVYAYPGYMTWDSVQQLQEARNPPLTDWHPPMMALLWRFTDAVIAGPFPMLVIQTALALFGLDGILRRVIAPRKAAIAAVTVFLFPPVMVVMAVIWKDSLMAGALLAGIAALLSPDRRWRIAGCVFLWFATTLRYNAPAATFPVVVLLFEWRALTRWRRYALSVGVWVAITLAAFGATAIVTGKKSYAWHNSVALLDISGTLYEAPKLDDTEVRELLGGMQLRPTQDLQSAFHRAYDFAWWGKLVLGDARLLDAPETDEARAAIATAWWNLVTTYPGAYFHHRRRVFWAALAVSQPPSAAIWDGFVTYQSDGDLIDHRVHRSSAQAWIVKQIRRFELSILFRPWAYLLVALLLLPLCRRSRLAFAVLCSGIAYVLTLLVAAPSVDYRYSHWMILTTCVGALVVFLLRLRRPS
jgi:hypothetical protein